MEITIPTGEKGLLTEGFYLTGSYTFNNKPANMFSAD